MIRTSAIRRWHLWLGWIAGVPLLLWTVSGLWMVARPIEEVRGEHLEASAPPLAIPRDVLPPNLGARPVKSIAIEPRIGGPVWTIHFLDGSARAANLATGAWLPPLTREAAIVTARQHYLGNNSLASVELTSAAEPPLDLRRPRPAWRIEFADGARVYVDRDIGGVLALRTRQWRWFDFMWGLHILDPGGREDTSHAVLIGAAAFSLATVLLGLLLLPLAKRFRQQRRVSTPVRGEPSPREEASSRG